jgi:para-aminobenzoate synthetase component 1
VKNEIRISANELVSSLLELSKTESVFLLDSCDVDHLGSHLLIAGIRPVEMLEFSYRDPAKTLGILNEKLSDPNRAAVFSIAYDFGLKLEMLSSRVKEFPSVSEPDVFLSLFDCLVVHDYRSGKTRLVGNEELFQEIRRLIENAPSAEPHVDVGISKLSSNFTEPDYIAAISRILEYIRSGETYQTNFTQQFTAELPIGLTAQRVFQRLRDDHPAPFAAFIKRKNDYVVSTSPERFVSVEKRKITVSPIKGTRPRGKTQYLDLKLREELLNSSKDRAENIMIVDLLRNDIGRVCKFGSIKVETLCDLVEHPTLFHLVSTVSGTLRRDVTSSDVIRAIFPCGSITGCPKIRTMQIIDELETADRGLSMGAIGYCDFDGRIDLNVAIRTAVIRDNQAVFNVGGGIVYDSDPRSEYLESMTKAKAILKALNASPDELITE